MLVEGRKQGVQISHPTTNDPLWFEKITLLTNHAQLMITFSNFLSIISNLFYFNSKNLWMCCFWTLYIH